VYTDIGGHGFPIGDIGSGAWIGLQAVQHCLRALDELAPRDQLTEVVLSHFAVSNALELVAACAHLIPKDYAAIVRSLLPLFNQECKSLDAIFATGTAYIQAMAEKLTNGNDLPIAFLGGLANLYAPSMDCAIQNRMRKIIHSPEQGALNFAKQEQISKEAV
jgi:glucosamine kinase